MGRWRLPGPEEPPGEKSFQSVPLCSLSYVGPGTFGKVSERLWATNGRQKWWFERFWDMAPGACWPPGSVVCARVCIEEIIARPFAGIKGGCRPKSQLTEGLNTAGAQRDPWGTPLRQAQGRLPLLSPVSLAWFALSYIALRLRLRDGTDAYPSKEPMPEARRWVASHGFVLEPTFRHPPLPVGLSLWARL